MSYYAEHQELLQRASLAFQREFPHGRIFPRHVGLFKTARNTPISIGIKGQADAYGWVPVWLPTGIKDGKVQGLMVAVHFEVEAKAGKKGLSDEQKDWKAACEATGVIYILLREENDIVEQIKNKLGPPNR